MEPCKQEKKIDKLELWKEGAPGSPGIEARVASIEGKLKDNGEPGMITKFANVYEWYLDQIKTGERRRSSKAAVFAVVMSIIQSGLLVALLTNS